MKAFYGLIIVAASLAGCTSTVARKEAVGSARTVADIFYQQVMYNLAVVQREQWAVPSHVKIEKGLVQVSDQVSPALKLSWPTNVKATRELTMGGSRQLIDNWSIIPVQGKELRRLQGWYQWAYLQHGSPTLQQEEPTKEGKRKQIESHLQMLRIPSLAPATAAPSAPAPAPAADELKPVPPELLPQGRWYNVGTGRPPLSARYSGIYHDTCVWVDDAHMADLAKFTMLIQDEASVKPEERGGGAPAALNPQ